MGLDRNGVYKHGMTRGAYFDACKGLKILDEIRIEARKIYEKTGRYPKIVCIKREYSDMSEAIGIKQTGDSNYGAKAERYVLCEKIIALARELRRKYGTPVEKEQENE